ncbi:MAG: nucleoside kinase [Pseudomonadota bacterium]
MVAPVVHIGGWPGAGKRAIGRRLAELTNGRLIDNHVMLDAARAIYDRGSPGAADLREQVRDVILSHAKNLPGETTIILTDALADEPEARPLFAPTVTLAQARGAPLLSFILDLSVDENLTRLQSPERSGAAKLKDPDILRSIRAEQTLFVPEGAVTLDVTDLSVDASAQILLAKIGLMCA